jgi:hypothetical protein
MCIASGKGLLLNDPLDTESAFAESPGRYLIELTNRAETSDLDRIAKVTNFATVQKSPKLTFKGGPELEVTDLTRAWRGTLDW